MCACTDLTTTEISDLSSAVESPDYDGYGGGTHWTPAMYTTLNSASKVMRENAVRLGVDPRDRAFAVNAIVVLMWMGGLRRFSHSVLKQKFRNAKARTQKEAELASRAPGGLSTAEFITLCVFLQPAHAPPRPARAHVHAPPPPPAPAHAPARVLARVLAPEPAPRVIADIDAIISGLSTEQMRQIAQRCAQKTAVAMAAEAAAAAAANDSVATTTEAAQSARTHDIAVATADAAADEDVDMTE